MDKMLAIIILFLGAMILTAAVISMGAVPKIFETNEIVNQTLLLQTLDDTRMKAAEHEDQARLEQTHQFRTTLQEMISEHHHTMQTYIGNLNNTTNMLVKELKENTELNEKIIREIDNATKVIGSELERYGENSLEKFDLLIEEENLQLSNNSTIQK